MHLKRNSGCGCLVFVLMAVLAVGAYAWLTSPSWLAYTALRDLKPGAWIATQEKLKQYLLDPSGASFPWYCSDQVRITHDMVDQASLYVIGSYVEAPDKQGAVKRSRFACAMLWQPGELDEQRWRLVGAVVMEPGLFKYLPPTLGGLSNNRLNDTIRRRLAELGFRQKAGEAAPEAAEPKPAVGR